jgi:hypothetical protein
MKLAELARLVGEPKIPTAEECARALPNYLVCTPYWGAIGVNHLDSVLAMRQLYPSLKCHRITGCAYIDIARATLCREAEMGGFDGVMFIDHDITFWPPDVPQLIETAEREQCCVSGIYSMRKTGDRMIGCFDPSVKRAVCFEGGGLYPAPYSGLGFTAIPRKVLEDVGRNLPLVKTGFSVCRPMFSLRCGVPDVAELVEAMWRAGIHSNGMPLDEMRAKVLAIAAEQAAGWYSGEDISFFHRVQRAGHRLLVDTRPRLFHEGSYLYGLEDVQVGVPRAKSLELELVPLDESNDRPAMVAASADQFEGAGPGVQRRPLADPDAVVATNKHTGATITRAQLVRDWQLAAGALEALERAPSGLLSQQPAVAK